MRGIALTAVKAAISAGLIYYLFNRIDGDHVLGLIGGIAPQALAAAFLLSIFQGFLIAARWGAVLQAIDAPLPLSKRIAFVFIGLFFNQVLPSSIGGDAVRMYAANRAGLRAASAISSVMLERLVTVIALLMVCAMLFPMFEARTQREIPALAVAAAVLAGILGILVLASLDRIPARFHGWRLIRGVTALAEDCRRIFFQPRTATICLLWGMAGNLNMSLVVYVLAVGIGVGDQVTLVDCLVLIPPVILFTSLPVSIGGWGVREGAMVAGLSLIGVTSESAVAISLLFGALSVAAAIPGGVLTAVMAVRPRPLDAAADRMRSPN